MMTKDSLQLILAKGKESRLPKVLLDEGLSSYGKVTGIGHHMVSLAQSLSEITDCDITRYGALRKIPRYFRRWAYIGACNMAPLYKEYDLVHHLATYVPLVRGKSKRVMTIYDLSSLHYPETISLAWRYRNQVELGNSVKRVDGIVAISQSVRQEIFQNFPGLDKSIVYVCPPGLRNELLACAPTEENLGRLDLKPFSYFVFVGVLTRRKNLKFLLSTFVEAKQRQLLALETKLVLVGRRYWGYSEFSALIREDFGIRELGYLTDEQIVALYRYSKGCVYPSIYEGFGMPIVEAMSQKTPIIISNIPTSMELDRAHNNQMFSFELGDREGLIRLFRQIDEQSQLIRTRLNYGDLSKYSYASIAAKHLSIYSSLLNKP